MAELPRTYDEWKYCITVKCGIALTQDYINERLRALSTMNDHATAKFVEMWGLSIRCQSVGLNRQRVSSKATKILVSFEFQYQANYTELPSRGPPFSCQ